MMQRTWSWMRRRTDDQERSMKMNAHRIRDALIASFCSKNSRIPLDGSLGSLLYCLLSKHSFSLFFAILNTPTSMIIEIEDKTKEVIYLANDAVLRALLFLLYFKTTTTTTRVVVFVIPIEQENAHDRMETDSNSIEVSLFYNGHRSSDACNHQHHLDSWCWSAIVGNVPTVETGSEHLVEDIYPNVISNNENRCSPVDTSRACSLCSTMD